MAGVGLAVASDMLAWRGPGTDVVAGRAGHPSRICLRGLAGQRRQGVWCGFELHNASSFDGSRAFNSFRRRPSTGFGIRRMGLASLQLRGTLFQLGEPSCGRLMAKGAMSSGEVVVGEPAGRSWTRPQQKTPHRGGGAFLGLLQGGEICISIYVDPWEVGGPLCAAGRVDGSQLPYLRRRTRPGSSCKPFIDPLS